MMRILLFGEYNECQKAMEYINELPELSNRNKKHRVVDDYDDFYKEVVDYAPHLTVVLADGANGMEGVYRSRQARPDVPVFWFSDDWNFGNQSHRLQCTYFSGKPMSADKFQRAIGCLLAAGGASWLNNQKEKM